MQDIGAETGIDLQHHWNPIAAAADINVQWAEQATARAAAEA